MACNALAHILSTNMYMPVPYCQNNTQALGTTTVQVLLGRQECMPAPQLITILNNTTQAWP
jgi:hypothetical protein